MLASVEGDGFLRYESDGYENPGMAEARRLWRRLRSHRTSGRGLHLGGWVTGSTARERATDQAKTEVVAALATICLEQSKHDPRMAERLAELKTTATYSRSELIMKSGWATMPGSPDANRQVANACIERLGL
jgi:hypothetical protein